MSETVTLNIEPKPTDPGLDDWCAGCLGTVSASVCYALPGCGSTVERPYGNIWVIKKE